MDRRPNSVILGGPLHGREGTGTKRRKASTAPSSVGRKGAVTLSLGQHRGQLGGGLTVSVPKSRDGAEKRLSVLPEVLRCPSGDALLQAIANRIDVSLNCLYVVTSAGTAGDTNWSKGRKNRCTVIVRHEVLQEEEVDVPTKVIKQIEELSVTPQCFPERGNRVAEVVTTNALRVRSMRSAMARVLHGPC